MWDEINYPFSKFNGAIVGGCERISNFIQRFAGCVYLSMLLLKPIHISKKGLLGTSPINYIENPFTDIGNDVARMLTQQIRVISRRKYRTDVTVLGITWVKKQLEK